jgi:hypothetical protein
MGATISNLVLVRTQSQPPCSSRFSSRLCGGRFNRSGDDSGKGISRYGPHFFLSLLARRHFFPYSLHRLTMTRQPQVPSESICTRALSRILPLANVRIHSKKRGYGHRPVVLPFSVCAHKYNISMYALERNIAEPSLFSRDNSLLFLFSSHLRMDKDAKNRTAIIRSLAWCDHG